MLERTKKFASGLRAKHGNIIRNTVWLSVAEIGSRIARGLLAIVAARMLGVSGLGVFAYALALGGFLTFFEEAGIGIFVTREFAKGSARRNQVFGTALILKLVLLAIAIATFFIIGPLASNIPGATLIIPAIALVLISDSLRLFFFSISRAQEQMQTESKVQMVTNILVVVFGIGFMAISPTPLALTLGYVVGGWVGLFMIIWQIRTYLPEPKSAFSKKIFVEIFAAAWPFTFLAISNVLIYNTDTLFIGHYSTVQQVGLYGAASRLVQVLYIVPTLIATTTFPLLVKKIAEPAAFGSALKKLLLGVTALAIPLVLLVMAESRLIMSILFGRPFAAAGPMLAILIVTCIPVFMSIILNNAIFALNRQGKFVIANIAGVVVNIGLDFLLVPRYAGIGAAIASVLGIATITIVTAMKIKNIDKIV